jgi:outer membrane protein
MARWFGPLVLIVISAASPRPVAGQDTTVAPRPALILTHDEALQQAEANSPAYRQAASAAAPARWAVRNAYGALLPHLQVSTDFGYTGSGNANFGQGFTRSTSSLLTSNYSLSIGWTLDGRTLTGPAQQHALQHATDEDITGAAIALRADVGTQYLTTLQAQAQTAVAREQLRRNDEFLGLARARHQVGQATRHEVRQAEVTRPTSEIAVIRAEQAELGAKLELFRRMGMTPPAPLEQIALADSFPVVAPHRTLAELQRIAAAHNPSLRALQAREDVAGWEVKAAKSDFLPSLSVQAGWSGYTQEYVNEQQLIDQQFGAAQGQAAQCAFDTQLRSALGLGGAEADCFAAAGLTDDGSALLDPIQRQIRAQNSVFPFHYTGQPFRVDFVVSLPIFTGFGRSLRLSQAKAQRMNAAESVRARQLELQTEVHARYLELQTAYRSIAVEAVARDAARDQLQLAEDRYRIGAGNALDVTDAQAAVQKAEGDYINAVYDYHKAAVALEAAVGQALR